MTASQSIFLSFFPLNCQDFGFTVYRRLCGSGDRKEDYPGSSMYRLPSESDSSDTNYAPYWVAFDPAAGLEPFLCSPHTNRQLTYSYLYRLLASKCRERLHPQRDFNLPDQGKVYSRRISFVINSHQEGDEIVWLEPYFLAAKRTFGYLVDFSFYSNEKNQSVRVLQLSLALDRNRRSNKSYYSDKYMRIQVFVRQFRDKVFQLNEHLAIEARRCNFHDGLLQTKQYEFRQKKTAASQFLGVRRYGPVSGVTDPNRIHFVFCERDRWLSNRLFRALRGELFPEQFPGMTKMFGCQFDRETVGGQSLSDFNLDEIKQAVLRAIESNPDKRITPVLVAPYESAEQSDLYYRVKHLCIEHDISCQFVKTSLIRDKRVLKWSASNIGLQLFCKLGGIPWLVKPHSNDCLIVGIGQAHSRQFGPAKKYFAYSVLTDASGQYKELRILGDDEDFGSYISNFRIALKQVILEHYAKYDRFVVHSSFKVRREEVQAVEDVIIDLAGVSGHAKEFVIMKLNQRNKYFAFSSGSNSMIPYESSVLQLSRDEYLVWFEGLQLHKPNVSSRVQRPLHIEFLYSNKELDRARHREYLQDAINVSGANWRGFNAKSLPVSIHYARLVAEFYREFEHLDLDTVDFQLVAPWFL